MRVESAKYNKPILPEHNGNPLIEALPPKLPWQEVMNKLSNYPDYAEDIAEHPDPLVREEYLMRIKELRQPLEEYQECFRAVERAIKVGYSARNPHSPTTIQYMHYNIDELPEITPVTGNFIPKGDGLTLIGDSGIGKSTMIEQVLNYFPSIIVHKKHDGKEVPFKHQVVSLKVDCPHSSSVRDLCEEILSALDLVLGRELTKPEAYIGSLTRQIEQHIKTCQLGILVIDEMQNLQFKKTGGENKLLNYIHRLVNKLGIPIFFIANPPFDESLVTALKAARRAESGYFKKLKVLDAEDQSWRAFIDALWNYQWTNPYTELSDTLARKLHELTCGNIDMAARTYTEAQRLLIGSDDETITETSLETAYNVACGLSKSTSEIIAQKTSSTLPSGPVRNSRIAKQNSSKKKTDKTGDITKPQHPEFAAQITTLLKDVDLASKIADPDKIQSALLDDNPLNRLATTGVLMSDPLAELG
ncbi:ATP-binding protein [Planctobacterium marinum]|uniref:Transposase n=1 Tax=Planctobacterium marinum TaxID=1631968 RepID=A0AA48HP92_9ALTE|nr:transposase [Planctobacterium marinum]